MQNSVAKIAKKLISTPQYGFAAKELLFGN